MKVLQVVPALQQGGVEWDAVELACALSAAGIENGIASAGGALVARLSGTNVVHHTLPLAAKNPLALLRNARRLAKLVETERYDLIHVRSRAPAWSVRLAAARTHTPWLATFHGVYGTKPPALKIPYNRVMLAGARTICVSDYVRRHVEAVYAPPPNQLVTIRDGADTARFFPEAVTPREIADYRAALGFDADTPVIVMAGRLTRWKGQHLLIEAVRRMKHAKVGVLFVGSDQGRTEYSDELRTRAQSLPPGKQVVFREHEENMPRVYALGFVAVNCSSGQPEAFGRVIPEAQAMGTLVIGTAHGGACETIRDGETGFLVPPGDVDALSVRLDALLDMPEAERRALRAAACRSVRENFSVETTCRETIVVYRNLLRTQTTLTQSDGCKARS